jgi:hypothetical protein
MYVTEGKEPREYFYAMRNLGIETWKQRVFYGFIFIVGYFYQPNWLYMNFYSNPKFRDGATWVPSFGIYSALSGFLTAVFIWAFIRFAKKYL